QTYTKPHAVYRHELENLEEVDCAGKIRAFGREFSFGGLVAEKGALHFFAACSSPGTPRPNRGSARRPRSRAEPLEAGAEGPGMPQAEAAGAGGGGKTRMSRIAPRVWIPGVTKRRSHATDRKAFWKESTNKSPRSSAASATASAPEGSTLERPRDGTGHTLAPYDAAGLEPEAPP
ncbi:hypothetical protein TGDOM2_398810, partial [Toxoplasma gondii GAB2-2007-GAL-DOM2]